VSSGISKYQESLYKSLSVTKDQTMIATTMLVAIMLGVMPGLLTDADVVGRIAFVLSQVAALERGYGSISTADLSKSDRE
jgi:hypothetical protein